MGGLLFTKNTNRTDANLNKIFCDSSSRTESLKLYVLKGKKDKKKNTMDVNQVKQHLHLRRSSGGIPNRCIPL